MVEIRFRLNCLDADRNLQNSQANRSRTPCGTRIQSAYKLHMQWNCEMLSLSISKKLNNVVLLLILIMTENSVVQRGTIPQRGCGQVIDSHRLPRTGNIFAHTDTVGKKKKASMRTSRKHLFLLTGDIFAGLHPVLQRPLYIQ